MSYDALLAAEEGAIAAQKGMWSKKPPTIKNYVDFSESLQKAKVQASVLQRQKKIPAIVDFVKSGSRFTVLIPRENGKITVVLSCIRAPRSARNASEASEPYGQEAHDFANRKCLQRDVEIDIEGVDKVGGFIGTIYVNRENFSKLLLEEGLATVHAYSAEQSSSGAELFAAEKKAQDARRGVWTNYDPNEGGEAATPAPANGDPAPPAPRKAVYHEGTLTYIDPDSLNLKIQIVGTGTGALEEMMTRFRNTHLSGTRPAALPTPPRAGEYVSAKFSQDGLWYRARIRRNDRDASASEVQYIDFGNEEKVPWSALRALPTNFGTGVLKAQAQDATLSCIQFPASKEYLKDAESYLYRELDSRSLGVRVDFTDKDGTMYVTLYSAADKEEDDSVNAALVALGLALVPKKVRVWEKGMEVMLAGLKKKEEGAKAEREGMWEYGDITEED
jgi:staphylococcal nuclease domain-containing protein 1